ncbi:unnamed protein product, partial [Mesorhabditis belari]|uniref:Uncharacterized protein n=1 Tax=Mesorhabditis belari TaxID=2138241 RepID=A0AAF3EKD0_9BILA
MFNRSVLLLCLFCICGLSLAMVVDRSMLVPPPQKDIVHVGVCDVNCPLGACNLCCTQHNRPQGGFCMVNQCWCL